MTWPPALPASDSAPFIFLACGGDGALFASLPQAAGTRVYVGNLPRDVQEAEVSDVFRRFGRIVSIWIARNPPGFAFVVRVGRAGWRRPCCLAAGPLGCV